MCARHGRGAIEICLSEKGVLAKKTLGNTDLYALSLLVVVGCNLSLHEHKLSAVS